MQLRNQRTLHCNVICFSLYIYSATVASLPPPPPPPSASRHTTQLHGTDITFNRLSQVTSPTHGRQSTYSLIMQMDFAGLATRFQEAITARDAAGQVSDLQLVPLLRAISLDLKHLLRDIRQRQRPTPAATPRVAPAAAPALILTPTSPATLEESPLVSHYSHTVQCRLCS